MDSVATPDEPASTASEGDVDAARRQLRARRQELCERELSRAFRRLEDSGGLSERERRIIRTLAERLTARLLGGAESSLRPGASGDTSAETARVALELFGDETPPDRS